MFGDVDNSSYLAQHEVFRPVLAVIRVRDEAEAVAIANDTTYGLALEVADAAAVLSRGEIVLRAPASEPAAHPERVHQAYFSTIEADTRQSANEASRTMEA